MNREGVGREGWSARAGSGHKTTSGIGAVHCPSACCLYSLFKLLEMNAPQPCADSVREVASEIRLPGP